MRTVGVSIAVPEPYFSQLREMRRAAGDPQADAVPPHVTLMPPTVRTRRPAQRVAGTRPTAS